MVNNWLDIIQDKLFPPSCILCEHPGYRNMELCRDCYDSLPLNAHCCYRCAEPFATPSASPRLCGHCLSDPPPYEETIAPFLYLRTMRYLVTGLKFGKQFKHARLLGTLLAEKIKQNAELPDCIVPVPLHKKRYRERGFNQSLEIGRTLAAELEIPLDLYSCIRHKNTEHQTRLPSKQRRKNLRQSFTIGQRPTHQHIALLDDVMTTGATVSELAKTLRRAGVERIDVWVCARA